jgi:hypothetical protein
MPHFGYDRIAYAGNGIGVGNRGALDFVGARFVPNVAA